MGARKVHLPYPKMPGGEDSKIAAVLDRQFFELERMVNGGFISKDENGDVSLPRDLAVTRDVGVGRNLDVVGATTLDGDVALGDAAADTISFNGTAGTNLAMGGNDISGAGAIAAGGGVTVGGDLGVTGSLSAGNIKAGAESFAGTIVQTVNIGATVSSINAILLAPDANLNVWYSNITATGFNINTSAAHTGNVSWLCFVTP